MNDDEILRLGMRWIADKMSDPDVQERIRRKRKDRNGIIEAEFIVIEDEDEPLALPEVSKAA